MSLHQEQVNNEAEKQTQAWLLRFSSKGLGVVLTFCSARVDIHQMHYGPESAKGVRYADLGSDGRAFHKLVFYLVCQQR